MTQEPIKPDPRKRARFNQLAQAHPDWTDEQIIERVEAEFVELAKVESDPRFDSTFGQRPAVPGSGGRGGGPGMSTPQNAALTEDVAAKSVENPARFRDYMRVAAQSPTFGMGDELIGGVRGAVTPGLSMGEAIEQEREGIEKVPGGRALLLELLTAGATGVGLARTVGGRVAPAAVRTMSAKRKIGTAAAGAGAAGAMYSFGKAEGNPIERLPEAAVGGAIGAGIGGALTGTANIPWLRKAGQIMRPLPNVPSSSPFGVATRAVGGDVAEDMAKANLIRGLDEDKLTTDAIRAAAGAADDQQPLTLMELAGENTQRAADVVAQMPGPGAARLVPAARERVRGQTARIEDKFLRALGLAKEDAVQTVDQLTRTMKANAKPAYDLAYTRSVSDPTIREAFQDIPVFQRAYERGREIANARRVKLPELFKPDGTVIDDFPVQALDYAKRGLDDLIESQIGSPTAFGKTSGAAYRERLKEVIDIAKNKVPEYRHALEQFAGDAAARDAFETGLSILDDKVRPTEIRQAVEAMSPSEQTLFRRGAYDAMRNKLRETGGQIVPETEAGAAGIMRSASGRVRDATLKVDPFSPNVQDRLKAIFGDTPETDDLIRFMLREGQFAQTAGRFGGSQTAARQFAKQDLFGEGIGQEIAAVTAASPSRKLFEAGQQWVINRLRNINREIGDEMATLYEKGLVSRADLLDMLKKLDAYAKSSAAGQTRKIGRSATRRGLAAAEIERLMAGK